jgi:hypothetical protein
MPHLVATALGHSPGEHPCPCASAAVAAAALLIERNNVAEKKRAARSFQKSGKGLEHYVVFHASRARQTLPHVHSRSVHSRHWHWRRWRHSVIVGVIVFRVHEIAAHFLGACPWQKPRKGGKGVPWRPMPADSPRNQGKRLCNNGVGSVLSIKYSQHMWTQWGNEIKNACLR